MSKILQSIATVLRSELILEERPIQFKEKREPDRPLAELKLRRNQEALVLSFDRCMEALEKPDLPDWLFPLTRPEIRLRKSCDYVVFCEINEEIWVLLVELKGKHQEEAGAQIANTRLMVDWILDVASFHASKTFDAASRGPKRHYRGIVFRVNYPMYRGTIPYILHPSMQDLQMVCLPYSSFSLQIFWNAS